MSKPILQRLSSGVGWAVASSVASQASNILRTIILARLLTHADFGLFGMAGTISGALAVLTNIGFGNAVVANNFQNDEEERTFLNTMWTVDIIRGVLLMLLILLAMYPASHFYNEPRLLGIWPALSSIPLLQAFSNVGMNLYRRQLEFAQVAKFDLISCCLQFGLPIVTILLIRDINALVWGQVAAQFLCSAISYCFHPFRPRLTWDQVAVKKGLNFSKHIFFIGLMVYCTSTMDNILIGKLLGAELLGVYVIAYSMANLPQQLVSKLFGGVLIGVYAEIGRSKKDRMNVIVGEIWHAGAVFISLITLPLIVCTSELVTFLYGPSWQATVAPTRILLLCGLLRGLIQFLAPLFMGLNRPELEARSACVEACVFAVVLYPLVYNFGMVGGAWAGVIMYTTAFVVRFWSARDIVPQAVQALPSTVLKVSIASIAGWLLAVTILRQSDTDTRLLGLLVGTVASITGASIILLCIDQKCRQKVSIIGKCLYPRYLSLLTVYQTFTNLK